MTTAAFERTLEVERGPEEVWKTLTDVQRVAAWVSIVESVTEQEPLARYRAVLKDQVGPFKLRADLEITCPRVVAGELVEIRASGEDRQIGSRISVDATLSLLPAEQGSMIRVAGTYEVAGRVATLGSGTINRKATKIIEQFFGAAGEALGAA